MALTANERDKGPGRITDADGRLVIAVSAGAAAATVPSDGRKVVTTAATRVPLSATSVPMVSVDITAETDNTGIIAVGGATVVALLASRQGTPLNAGETSTFYNVDLSKVYIDSTVNGDGVTWAGVAA